MLTLGEMVELNAGRVGAKTAIVWRDYRITHRQLNSRSSAIANAVGDMGINKGDRVALLASNCHQFIEVHVACSKVGAILVPLNTMLSPGELSLLINHSEAKLLVFTGNFLSTVQVLKKDIPRVRDFIAIDGGEPMNSYEDLVARYPDTAPEVKLTEDDIADITYTSGTTGTPKGVMLTNGNLFSNAVNAAICCHIPLGGVEVVPFPLFFSAIFNSHVIPYMLAEGGVVILDRFHPEHLIDAINQERPTYTTLNPTMLNDFITHPRFQECDLGSLQGILVAAAPLSLARMQRAWRALGKILVQGYGLTESTSFSTCTRIDDYDESDLATFRRRLTSVGRVVPTLEIKVVDEQGGDIPHDGEAAGEIVVRGPSVMAGYWKQPEATKTAIKNGWLYTGDLGTMDEEGYVWMVGRKKDVIISGGINIYPEEVEAVLYTLPEIAEVAVVGRPDERWGEAVTAIIVAKPGEKISEEAVVAHCRQKIAGYKKPTRVIFVDRLPHNASGKIKKNALREMLARGEL